MKVYMTQDTSAGGKFWQIETKGKKYTTRYGKIGCTGRETTKSFDSKKKCEATVKNLIRKKKNGGYSEKTTGKKRKQMDYSSDEASSDDEPPTKKRKTNTKRKKKKKKESSSEEEEESDGYDSDENEKILRKMLQASSVLLQDGREKNKFEIVVNDNKSYSIVQGKIGSNGKKKTKSFASKKKAFNAALTILMAKMRGKWTIVESEAEQESENEASESSDEPGIFDDLTFAISGGFSKSQTDIKNLLKDNGATIKTAPTKQTDFLLVKAIQPNLNSTKCGNAKKYKIPIVSEDFLFDCVEKNKLLKYKEYIVEELEEEEEEEESDGDEDVKMKDKKDKNDKNKNKKKVDGMDQDKDKDENDESENENDNQKNKKKKSKSHKTQTFKGSAPVDEYFERGVNGHSVFEEHGVVYDAMLNQTNIGNNNNKFYKLQVVKDDDSNSYYAWFRWARVGYKGQTKCIPGGKDACIAAFKKKFYDKTLNNWEDRNDFDAHAKKYTYIEMDYGNGNADEDNESDDDEEMKIQSKLDKDTQGLVKLIFSKDMFEEQMKEIGYDAAKLPLGKVSKSIITKAYKILKDIEVAIRKGTKEMDDEEEDDDDDDDVESDDNDNNKNKKRRSKRKKKNKSKSGRTVKSNKRLEELSSAYYTLIPHEFGMKKLPVIKDEKLLNREMKLIESLSEIEVATKLLANAKKESEKHIVDRKFDLLKCDIESVERKSDEFKMLDEYVQLTHASTHNRYSLKVERAFKLDREGSGDRYGEWDKNKNRMLLWHGSRLTNFVGIISQGLRIAPPEAPVTGYMFGKGVYFADMCSKSANYCFTTRDNPTGLILLCEVALGDMNELLHSDYYAAENCKDNNKESTKGCGSTIPDPKTYTTLDNGCIVPMGKGINNKAIKHGSLLYNEYIVYNTAQIKMKYLLKLKFDYGDNAW